MNNKTERTIRPKAGIVLVYKNKVLLVQQKYSSARCKWGFPKGGIDHRESEKQCAYRELQEETGINLKKYKHRRVGILNQHNTKYLNYKCHFYVLQLLEHIPEEEYGIAEDHSEIRQIKWCTIGEAKRFKGNWTLRPIVKILENSCSGYLRDLRNSSCLPIKPSHTQKTLKEQHRKA